MSKVVLDYSTLASQTHCALELSELLSTILLLANISWDSSLGRFSYVYIVYILLKQENIYYMNIVNSTNTWIIEEILLLTFLYFSNLTLVLFLFNLSLTISSKLSTTIWLYIYLFSLFFLLFFFFFCFFLFILHVVSVCMYVVTK